MDDIIVVEVVDSLKDLSNCLRGILLRKLAIFADTVEEFSPGGQLGNDIVFILKDSVSAT